MGKKKSFEGKMLERDRKRSNSFRMVEEFIKRKREIRRGERRSGGR